VPAIRITSKSSVEKDLRRIEEGIRLKIMDKIALELTRNPCIGKRLKGRYEGLYSFRVGDYRVVYELTGSEILILRIAHRKEVYRQAI